MQARQRNGDGKTTAVGSTLKRDLLGRLRDIRCRDFGAVPNSISNHPGGRFRPHRQNQLIIGIQHGNAGRRQGFDQFILGCGDIRHRAKSFQMRFSYIRHHADRRQGDRGQFGNLAAPPHPHLDDHRLMRDIQSQQRLRQSDFIVEVRFCLQHIQRSRQYGGNHVLGRGLAVGSGHRNQRDLEPAAVESSQILQGLTTIFHPYYRYSNSQRQHSRHDDTGRAFGNRFCCIIVPVEFFS